MSVLTLPPALRQGLFEVVAVHDRPAGPQTPRDSLVSVSELTIEGQRTQHTTVLALGGTGDLTSGPHVARQSYDPLSRFPSPMSPMSSPAYLPLDPTK